MTRFNVRNSGLVLPVAPPEHKRVSKMSLEISSLEDRELAKEAFAKLWVAAGLRECSILQPPHLLQAREQAFRYLENMLLGDDAGDHEQLT